MTTLHPMNPTLETQKVLVRGLKPEDFDSVVRLDGKNTGRRREEYFKVKLQQNLQETGVKVSLAAEFDGAFVGFLLARVYYGEFGISEPTALLDTIDVHPDFKGHGVGRALLDQLNINLNGLGVHTLRTEVSWDAPDLIAFFNHSGFHPAPRLCLDLDLEEARKTREEREEAAL
ncbi:MAG: GNAT family N-acetyltransferase [Planctomycetes bacterium]|nr:GNAT family N-acetyltransferase [Planctomycetota bacterium]